MRTVHREGLPWPANKARRHDRKPSLFKNSNRLEPTIPQAAERVVDEIDRFTPRGQTYRTSEVTIWSWTPLGVKGNFVAGRRPSSGDPGVVVAFDLDKRVYTIACDRYTTIPGNLCAVAAYIEGLRAQERHGVADLGEMLAGHLALPEATAGSWWHVLEVTFEELRENYALLRKNPNARISRGVTVPGEVPN